MKDTMKIVKCCQPLLGARLYFVTMRRRGSRQVVMSEIVGNRIISGRNLESGGESLRIWALWETSNKNKLYITSCHQIDFDWPNKTWVSERRRTKAGPTSVLRKTQSRVPLQRAARNNPHQRKATRNATTTHELQTCKTQHTQSLLYSYQIESRSYYIIECFCSAFRSWASNIQSKSVGRICFAALHLHPDEQQRSDGSDGIAVAPKNRNMQKILSSIPHLLWKTKSCILGHTSGG